MAELVLALGSSHSPVLNSPAEESHLHVEIDKAKRPFIDKEGNKATYDQLVSLNAERLKEEVKPEVIKKRVERCLECIDLLSQRLAKANPDIVIVIGDDQHEQFFEDHMPSILVYWGETISNTILDLPETAPEFWKRARSMFHEDQGVQEYPVASEFGLHLIEHLMENEFDVSHSKKLPKDRGEGHAFGFVHKKLMQEKVVPILPIALNTYFPPNNPRPKRCVTLGKQILQAIKSWPKSDRIAIVASGGLSHFTVDEDLDKAVLKACLEKDDETLSKLPINKLVFGNSEIRNWITVASAASELNTEWQEYVPYYRSEAGTGVGAAFAVWSHEERI